MSFMFNPYPYDDPRPVNPVPVDPALAESIVEGPREIAAALASELDELCRQLGRGMVLGLDSYPTADDAALVRLVGRALAAQGRRVEVLDLASLYRDPREIEALVAEHLPEDLDDDPVLLFGRIFHGGLTDLLDPDKVADLSRRLAQPAPADCVRLVRGCGAGIEAVRTHCDRLLYLDVTPKDAVLAIKDGRYRNMGDDRDRPYKETMRRCYYVDFEVCSRLRAALLQAGQVDYYLAAGKPDRMQLLPRAVFEAACAALVRQPFRCKPVYNEGVWGGTYTKRLRGLPEAMKNCAWVFDLIPLEVSVLMQIGESLVDIPYLTFVRQQGEALMGAECVEAFGGFFPIRFNYDDTYHANGNMSIQVHPVDSFIKERFSEFARQDESYYVVATGHGAKTYCGLQQDVDLEAFWAAIHRSEQERTPVEYDRFVNSVPSFPGRQFLLPAGTIHSSGRNQVVLEIGSLTVGSYTFKLYDYLRLDLDGTPRPIHSRYGKEVLQTQRQSDWVADHLVQEPRQVSAGDGWTESIVGEHDLIYFSLRRIEFEQEARQDTGGRFHVLALVDGEQVVVESVADPSRCFTMQYLDIIVVPAGLGAYRIRNLGTQPVCMHKTCLKDGFRDSL